MFWNYLPDIVDSNNVGEIPYTTTASEYVCPIFEAWIALVNSILFKGCVIQPKDSI
jgi:hypothetical protein